MIASPVGNPALLVALSGLIVLVSGLLILDRQVQRQARLRTRFTTAAGAGRSLSGFAHLALLLSNEVRTACASVVRAAGVLRVLGTGDRGKMRLLLQSAGYRSGVALANFFGAKLAASVAGIVGSLALVANGVFAGTLALQIVFVFMGFFIAGLAPEMVVRRLAKRRQEKLRAALPDAIDLLIIATNAGQSLEVALNRVSHEVGRTSPELADELKVTTSELRALPNRREALENLASRTSAAEVRSLTATLIQTIRYGTPLTQSLRVLAAELRQAKLIALEEKAAKLPALLALPLMLLIMPSIFIVTAGPAVLGIGDAIFGQQ